MASRPTAIAMCVPEIRTLEPEAREPSPVGRGRLRSSRVRVYDAPFS